MKIISKINSITSLNDKNLEKFACNIGNFGNSTTSTTNNNNNTRFMNAKSFIDFIPSSSNQNDKDPQQQHHKVDGFGILDAQSPIGSAKRLKFNNGDSNSIFWDSFKIGNALSSQPTTSTSNLRNTVSSSNLAIGYTDNQQTQPKFYNFNPQQHQQQQSAAKSAQDEQLAIMRKNSLPQNTSSCNYSNNLSENDNMNLKNNNNKDLKSNDMNVNSLKSSISSSKMTSSNELQQQQKQLQHQQIHQQQQQQQNSSQNEPIKPSQTKWPIVATPHQVILINNFYFLFLVIFISCFSIIIAIFFC